MDVLRLPADPARRAATTVVLLPGAYQRVDDFVAAGFAEPARAAGIDLLVPELDLVQLTSGEAPERVFAELVEAERSRGAGTLWLGGISLGGFNALCLAEAHTEAIDGLCLLAPWPGGRIARREIEAAGGLHRWQPSAETLAADAELRVWHFLKGRADAARRLPVFIGWGRDDRFAAGIAALAAALPESTPQVIAGGHHWPVWSELWQRCCAQRPWAHGTPPEHHEDRRTTSGAP